MVKGFVLTIQHFKQPFFLLLACPPQPHRILQALRRYVRAENKDRQHTIRHYQHVLAVDPEKAAQMKSQVSVCTLPNYDRSVSITNSRSPK